MKFHLLRCLLLLKKTNKVTEGFQALVDAYGVAKYEEVNPALFTVISFPFLFAVMFGDLGHGVIASLAAGWLVHNEKKLLKSDGGEIMEMVVGGRYIILFMGLFSIFTGLIYNDIFSQAMTIMSSGWTFHREDSSNRWVGIKSETYGFGVDLAWHSAENALIFLNSYKMKMAIIFGVFHMSFGISLQCYNHIRFGKKAYIYLEFLPQILCFLSIFGYLVFLIVFKWFVHYTNPSTAPGLLNTLIYMFLSPGTVAMPLFPGQSGVQVFLLLVAFISVPWMLLGRPYYELNEHKKTTLAGYIATASPGDAIEHGEVDGVDDEHGHQGFDFGEAMIHQGIHTIEFSLSGIPNTASYLRLWALSLPHAQLSEVLWKMILEPSLRSANAIYIAFGFYICGSL